MDIVLIVKNRENLIFISDFPCIPTVGSFFQYFSVRDENGYYLNEKPVDNNCRRNVISGKVKSIQQYSVKEYGYDSQTFKKVLYVTIQLKKSKEK